MRPGIEAVEHRLVVVMGLAQIAMAEAAGHDVMIEHLHLQSSVGEQRCRQGHPAPPLNAVILTLGLYTLLVAIAGMIWGNTPRSFPAAFSLRGYKVGGTNLLFTPNDTFIVLVVISLPTRLRP